MAGRLLFAYLVLALAFCSIMEDTVSDHCRFFFNVEAAKYGVQSRKILHGSDQAFKSPEVVPFDWALRAVPSGPDPMHHNIGGPKKPQAP